MYWPEYNESATNHQYIFLDDILVAPITDSKANVTTRSVWIPPGEWEDAWDGSVVIGPKTITAAQPYERQPMWHRKDGGLIVLADKPTTRVEDQDWSSLTLEVFPSKSALRTSRAVFERSSEASTQIVLDSDGDGKVRLEIGNSQDGTAREWVVRVHLRPNQHVTHTSVDGLALESSGVRLLEAAGSDDFFPLAGAGSAPPQKAGPVAEVQVPKGSHARVIEIMTVTDGSEANLYV
jgi:hypothetical protein